MPKLYTACIVLRHKLVTHYSSLEDAVAGTIDRVEWVTEECNSPLFGDERMKRGTCDACHRGWSVPGNHPASGCSGEHLSVGG